MAPVLFSKVRRDPPPLPLPFLRPFVGPPRLVLPCLRSSPLLPPVHVIQLRAEQALRMPRRRVLVFSFTGRMVSFSPAIHLSPGLPVVAKHSFGARHHGAA